MNIIVVDIAAEYGGALTILKDFYNFVRFDERARTANWKFIVSCQGLEDCEHISVDIVPKGKFVWVNRLWYDNVRIRRICKSFRPDTILSLQNTIVNGIKNVRQCTYIHQSIPYQKERNFPFFKTSEFKLAIYQHIIGHYISQSALKAQKVFVQNEWMKRNVSEKLRCPQEKITVVPINKKHNVIEGKGITWNKKSFFYPAFFSLYKNQKVIIEAADILERRGCEDFEITLTTNSSIASKFIREVGQLSHEDTLKMLSQSTLIFPSYIETVGIPLIEAMETGTYILAADCEYAHETLNGYENVSFFNPFNPVQLADLIEDVLSGKIVKKAVESRLVSTSNNWNKLLDELLYS